MCGALPAWYAFAPTMFSACGPEASSAASWPTSPARRAPERLGRHLLVRRRREAEALPDRERVRAPSVRDLGEAPGDLRHEPPPGLALGIRVVEEPRAGRVVELQLGHVPGRAGARRLGRRRRCRTASLPSARPTRRRLRGRRSRPRRSPGRRRRRARRARRRRSPSGRSRTRAVASVVGSIRTTVPALAERRPERAVRVRQVLDGRRTARSSADRPVRRDLPDVAAPGCSPPKRSRRRPRRSTDPTGASA